MAAPRTDVLSAVCHDLREPLASVMMGVSYLQRVVPASDASMVRVVEGLQRAASAMGNRIAFFSDLAQLQANELRLHVDRCEVGRLLAVAVEQLSGPSGLRGVPVSIDPGALAPRTVRCDQERIAQVLQLLGACALRVVPEGGTVLFRVEAGADRSTITLVMEARPPAGLGARRLSPALPSPEVALAAGLVALHDARLHVEHGDSRLTMSFELPLQDGVDTSSRHARGDRGSRHHG